MQSPGFMKRSEKDGDKNREKIFARRHSSVERYLETKELDSYIPKYVGDGDDVTKRSRDAVDGKLIEVTEFRSHPNLSDHEIDSRSEVPTKSEKRKKLASDQKKDYLSPSGARVTFSDSTCDVRSERGSVVSQRQNLSSMLDFQLDVVVEIESGKCVLHSDKDHENNSQMR